MRDILRRLVDAKDGVELVEGAVSRDHVHMCLRIAPKHSVAKVMGYLKGKSALILFDHSIAQRGQGAKDHAARGLSEGNGGNMNSIVYLEDRLAL